ncbi:MULTISPECIES: hypothetical protein [Leptolyngbya]|uniref:hypothetical protein n=1 Tax=Leptolyngbya TaxID=47251 RepID=UPI001686BE7E|nr:hypothetical protein [Leptolyngbya sp. FACHB-1624]MBD1855570.1 hypothetical protein [Leptolyngbya sp. FACHB-1624]
MQIQLLKKTEAVHEHKWFIAMLEGIRGFMIANSEQDEFILEGELQHHDSESNV